MDFRLKFGRFIYYSTAASVEVNIFITWCFYYLYQLKYVSYLLEPRLTQFSPMFFFYITWFSDGFMGYRNSTLG